jgi:hypothetical protein
MKKNNICNVLYICYLTCDKYDAFCLKNKELCFIC